MILQSLITTFCICCCDVKSVIFNLNILFSMDRSFFHSGKGARCCFPGQRPVPPTKCKDCLISFITIDLFEAI